MGAPPSTAYAGDTAARLNASPAARLVSALTRRKLNEMIEVFTSLLRFDYFKRCTILSGETSRLSAPFAEHRQYASRMRRTRESEHL
jgi:hypothetical protein